jgi:sec-independent protein translocase protein TatA
MRKAATMFDEKYLIVIVVVALLFGASRLPSIARNLGLGIKEFKRGINDATDDDDQDQNQTPEATDTERRPSS